MQVATLYTIFAILATIINLGCQEVASRLYQGEYSFWVAITVGTAGGLVMKYILDKRYIFKYTTNSIASDTWTFFMYTAMGIVTTLIFWVSEWLFEYWFEDRVMRYIGACIGLSIGYVTKYFLDKRFVFTSVEAS